MHGEGGHARAAQPERVLRAFAKTPQLAAGEATQLCFRLGSRDLSVWEEHDGGRWALILGAFEVLDPKGGRWHDAYDAKGKRVRRTQTLLKAMEAASEAVAEAEAQALQQHGILCRHIGSDAGGRCALRPLPCVDGALQPCKRPSCLRHL